MRDLTLRERSKPEEGRLGKHRCCENCDNVGCTDRYNMAQVGFSGEYANYCPLHEFRGEKK